MRRFYSLIFFIILGMPLFTVLGFGSTLIEDRPVSQASTSLCIKVLGRSTCRSLQNRVLMMVKIEDESGHSHIKPFYKSSGMNSGSADTHFPFENISGRFGEVKFTQFYVEKVHVDYGEYITLRPLMVGDGASLAPRFGNLLYARVSALLEGGFWDTPDGIESKRNMGVMGNAVLHESECLMLQTSADVRNWMRSFDYKIRPGLVFSNQYAYARFSYEVLLTLVHRLDGGVTRNSLGESYRQLCMRVKDRVQPKALALLVPGFEADYSLHDYSRYVDENIFLKKWRSHNAGFLPISINFYIKGLTSEAIGADMAVLRQIKFVKENKLPHIPSKPINKMNLLIERFLKGECFIGEPKCVESKAITKAKTFYGMTMLRKLHVLHSQARPRVLKRSISSPWLTTEFETLKILKKQNDQKNERPKLKRTVAFHDLSLFLSATPNQSSSKVSK